MTFHLDRRRILQLGAFGTGALVVPGTASAIARARGFTHGVASGEPTQDSILLWTRYVGGSEAKLVAEVAESESFDRVVAGAEAAASPTHDFTVKGTVSGLQSGRWYYYRFRDSNGRSSPTGRTRTLPDGAVGRFGIGVFSCSNLSFGWFNAYAHAAARDDLDLVVHLGDYLYEYERGDYPAGPDATAGRRIEPAGEIVHLNDYRLRHAAYRADPDLRRMLQNFPLIAMWDDHESANDSWVGGAQNHQPETEGPWDTRKAAAIRAYREWMPVSDAAYEEYRIGDLATLFRPETRLTGRTKQLWLEGEVVNAVDLNAAIKRFRDGPWQDPSHTLMGLDQEKQLAEGLRRSRSSGVRWQILAQQVVMGQLLMPKEAAAWIGPEASKRVRDSTRIGLAASALDVPSYLDSWDGYPAARSRLLRSAQEANANLIVLSGDSHNAWAFDLNEGGSAAGVEFAGQSVTSPGYESDLAGVGPSEIGRALRDRNPLLKWADLRHRGYFSVELTPTRATVEWQLLRTIRQRSTQLDGTHRLTVAHGSNRIA